MDTLQPFLVDMGIDLRRGDIGMAEHHLYRTEVGAVAEQVGGKGVADYMRRYFLGYTGYPCGIAENLPETQSGHTGAAPGDEQIVAAFIFEDERSRRFHVVVDFLPGLLTKGNQPFFVALAENPDESGVEIARRQRQTHQFGDPEAGGIKDKQHGIIPFADGGNDIRRGEQAHDFFLRQGLGERFITPRQIDGKKGVFCCQIFPNKKIVERF